MKSNKIKKLVKKKNTKKNRIKTGGSKICRNNRSLCFGNNHQFYTDSKNELIKFYNLLQKLGLTVFLAGGTLLGCIRENNLMSNDDDICLGLIEYYDTTKLIEKLFENRGYNKMIYSGKEENGKLISKIRKDNYGNETTIFKQFTFSKKINNNLIEFDITVCHQDPINNHFVDTNYFDNKVQFYLYKPFNLKLIHFLNSYFYIPENYNEYLNNLYGNWKDENPFFKWSDSPCLSENYNYSNLRYFD